MKKCRLQVMEGHPASSSDMNSGVIIMSDVVRGNLPPYKVFPCRSRFWVFCKTQILFAYHSRLQIEL